MADGPVSDLQELPPRDMVQKLIVAGYVRFLPTEDLAYDPMGINTCAKEEIKICRCAEIRHGWIVMQAATNIFIRRRALAVALGLYFLLRAGRRKAKDIGLGGGAGEASSSRSAAGQLQITAAQEDAAQGRARRMLRVALGQAARSVASQQPTAAKSRPQIADWRRAARPLMLQDLSGAAPTPMVTIRLVWQSENGVILAESSERHPSGVSLVDRWGQLVPHPGPFVVSRIFATDTGLNQSLVLSQTVRDNVTVISRRLGTPPGFEGRDDKRPRPPSPSHRRSSSEHEEADPNARRRAKRPAIEPEPESSRTL